MQERGEVLGHVLEEPAPALLLALDPVPVGEHLAGALRARLAEDVRVAADQLLRRPASATAARSPGPALLEQQREEEDLEEDVAELVEQLLVVAARGRVGQLVGLLDGVRDDRALVLLAVPGALAAQAAGDLVEAGQRRGGARGGRRVGLG